MSIRDAPSCALSCPNTAGSTFAPSTCPNVRLSRVLYNIEDGKHDVCMLMNFSSTERPSVKQPRAGMQCINDGGLVALPPHPTGPHDGPLDQVPVKVLPALGAGAEHVSQ